MEITQQIAEKVLAAVDAGLVKGVGKPVPGRMCVEAAVCYAMGLPHGDNPSCVAPALRSLKIRLNDCSWSSKEARASGLRRLALAQLGSAGLLDEKDFSARVAEMTIRKILPLALRAAASRLKGPDAKALESAAVECETTGILASAGKARAAADAASAAADAADAAAASAAASAAADAADAARDNVLGIFAENVVQILVHMKAPGVQWLDLAPMAEG